MTVSIFSPDWRNEILRYLNATALSVLTDTDFFRGFEFANTPGSPTWLTISPGACRDALNSTTISLSGPLLKDVSQPWAQGNGGGWDFTLGAVPAGYFFIHAIYNATLGVSDILFSLSLYAPVMPSGFTARRLIGAAAYTGTLVYPIINQGEWTYFVPRVDIGPIAISTSAILLQVPTPIGCKCQLLADVLASTSDSNMAGVTIRDPDLGAFTPTLSTANVFNGTAPAAVRDQMILVTNTAGKVLVGSTNTTSLLTICGVGFRIDRTIYR